MECEDVRAALSARLDGEPTNVDDDLLDAHLSACESCRAWYEQAISLNRALSLGPTSEIDLSNVDFSEEILLQVEPERRRRERTWLLMAGTARGVLVILGIAWSAWAVMTIVGAESMLVSDQSLPNEVPLGGRDGSGVATVDPLAVGATLSIQLAAIRLALGVGLFWAAWRPRAAMGMAPVYGAVAMFSIGFGIRDVIVGAQAAISLMGMVLMALSAVALAMVWLGGYTPAALAQAWRAASGLPVAGVPIVRDKD